MIKSQNPIKFLVFDWDGTLMDSAGRIVSCLEYAIRTVGLPPKSPQELRHIIGLGMHEALAYLYPNEDIDSQGVAAAYRDQFMGGNTTESVLFDGVSEMLNRLEEQGYWLAVATGKSRSGLNYILKELGLQKRFHATRCADETASKPHPMMLNELMAECNFSIDETLMVGDTEFDIEMANVAKVRSVAVKGGAHHESHLKQFNPAAILDNILDLEKWLQVNNVV